MGWLRGLAYRIGRLITAPFRAIVNVIKGFLDGLFGK